MREYGWASLAKALRRGARSGNCFSRVKPSSKAAAHRMKPRSFLGKAQKVWTALSSDTVSPTGLPPATNSLIPRIAEPNGPASSGFSSSSSSDSSAFSTAAAPLPSSDAFFFFLSFFSFFSFFFLSSSPSLSCGGRRREARRRRIRGR